MTKHINKLYLNAGQMKAGTTFLYRALVGHSDIFFSPEKEIHYLSYKYGIVRFMGDAVRLRKAKNVMRIANDRDKSLARYQQTIRWMNNYLENPDDPEWYNRMFEEKRATQWAADFSNLTCTIPVEGLLKVKDLAEDVRVTYCLRDPVKRAISHAKFHLQVAGVDPDINKMSLIDLRAFLVSDNIWLQAESDIHIERLITVFGEKKVRIVLCESMWKTPQNTVTGICKFLDIPPLSSEIAGHAVNVGPKVDIEDRIREVFAEVFEPLQERSAAVLKQYADLVIT